MKNQKSCCLELPAPKYFPLKTFRIILGRSTAPIDKGKGEQVLTRKDVKKRVAWSNLFPGIPYKGRTKYESVDIIRVKN